MALEWQKGSATPFVCRDMLGSQGRENVCGVRGFLVIPVTQTRYPCLSNLGFALQRGKALRLKDEPVGAQNGA